MSMGKDQEIYVAEFSPAQGAYHVDTMEHSIAVNAWMIANGRDIADFIPFCMGSEDDCYWACAKMRRTRGEAGPEELGALERRERGLEKAIA